MDRQVAARPSIWAETIPVMFSGAWRPVKMKDSFVVLIKNGKKLTVLAPFLLSSIWNIQGRRVSGDGIQRKLELGQTYASDERVFIPGIPRAGLRLTMPSHSRTDTLQWLANEYHGKHQPTRLIRYI